MAEAMIEEMEAKTKQREAEEMEQVLKECTEELQQKDSILEPTTARTLEQYVQVGGTLEDALDLMVGSFADIPTSLNKMMELLHLSGMKKKEVQALVEDHLKDLVLKHFDPRKADRIFAEAGSTPPWLEEMIGYPTWRNLVYQLAEQFPDCLMLKFAIKLISDAGYQNEITSVATAAKDFHVFCSLFASHLSSITTSNKQDVFSEHLTEFLKLTCHADHTYVHSQAVLCALEQTHPDSKPLLRWIAQQMALEASGRIQEPLKWTLLLKGVGAFPQLFEALNSMLARNVLNPADMAMVYQHYADLDRVPPADFLRIPHFLDLLVHSLFKQGSTVNPEHEHKYTFVLAYAASVWDQSADSLEADPVLDELEGTQKAVQQAYSICQKGSVSHTDLQTSIRDLYDALQYPVVSKGVLLWLESILLDVSFFEMSMENAILYLSLLDEIATCHPLHHPELLHLLQRLFEASVPSSGGAGIQLDLQKVVVERMVHLALCGYAVCVISYLSECTTKHSMDHSLVRHFVHEVLSAIEPPYSAPLAAAFTPVLANRDITDSMRSEDGSDLVTMFLENCSKKSKKRRR